LASCIGTPASASAIASVSPRSIVIVRVSTPRLASSELSPVSSSLVALSSESDSEEGWLFTGMIGPNEAMLACAARSRDDKRMKSS